jgi:hypothetical protein
MKFYSAIQKNEIVLFEGKWMELEIILIGEISQTQKTSIIFSHMQYLKGKKKNMKVDGRSWAPIAHACDSSYLEG